MESVWKVRGKFGVMWAWKVQGKFGGMWAWKVHGKFGVCGRGKFGCGVNKRKRLGKVR